MSEEWLKHIANSIKRKDHDDAERFAKEKHRADLIHSGGPVLWRSLADFLKAQIDELKDMLQGDVTLTEGPLDYSFRTSGAYNIEIKKKRFPFVQFEANYQAVSGVIGMNYFSVNPGPPTVAVSLRPIPCRFEVNHENRVFLQLDGRSFLDMKDATEHIMKKLFAAVTDEVDTE